MPNDNELAEVLPYDKEQYKLYFDEAKRRFPNLDDFLIHLGVVNLLLETVEDMQKAEEMQKTYFKDDTFEGIILQPIEAQE